jgi:hypothetical protein
MSGEQSFATPRLIVCGRRGAAVSLSGRSTRRPQLNPWYVRSTYGVDLWGRSAKLKLRLTGKELLCFYELRVRTGS